jgi:hypothetical protein
MSDEMDKRTVALSLMADSDGTVSQVLTRINAQRNTVTLVILISVFSFCAFDGRPFER